MISNLYSVFLFLFLLNFATIPAHSQSQNRPHEHHEAGDHDHGDTDHDGEHEQAHSNHDFVRDHADADHTADHHHEGLHFSHPLFTESPTPDTKFRVNYGFTNLNSGHEAGSTQMVTVGGEYAFHRAFSVEVEFPFQSINPDMGGSFSNTGNLNVSLKFANFAFEKEGLLLGYGVEFGLPTGNDAKAIGSDHLIHIEPFLNIALKKDRVEAVAFTIFGVPTNQHVGEEIETDFEYNFSLLYHVAPQLQSILELNGETILSGEKSMNVTMLSPGVKFLPLKTTPELIIGIGIQVPLTHEKEFDVGAMGSVFYHF